MPDRESDRSYTPSWQPWGLREWGEAFFDYFFKFSADDAPVTRLPITDITWHEVTKDRNTNPDDMERAFINTFPKKRKALQLNFSKFTDRDDLVPPSSFPYLILTCVVAAASEEESEEGDFRERLRDMLGMKDTATLPLSGLNKIWEEFTRWLDNGRTNGQSWRQLVLPEDVGRETIIGYSKRLVFPTRKDWQRLADLLIQKNLPADPPLSSVLSIVKSNLLDFGETFQRTFNDFELRVREGTETDAHPFWAAVLEALRTSQFGGNIEAARGRLELLLLMEFGEFDDPVLSLLTKASWHGAGIATRRLDFEVEGYDHLLINERNNDSQEPVSLLLNGILFRQGLHSPLLQVVKDGLLIFQKVGGYYSARIKPPEPGSVVVLINRCQLSRFLEALGPLDAQHKPSRYGDSQWYWLDRLDGQQILSRLKDREPFQSLSCLARTVRPASIGVQGGILCKEGSYLGRFHSLPEFRFEGAQQMRLTPPAGINAALELKRCQTGWRVVESPASRSGLEGEFKVVAETAADARASMRRIRFQRDVLSWNYASPSDPDAWEIEAGLRDVTSLSPDDRSLWDIGASWESEQYVEMATPMHTVRLDSTWRRTGLGDLVETLAAIGTTRTSGLAETELLDWFHRCLRIGDQDRRLVWEIARAWTETGLLQRASDRRWRAARYFLPVPRLCLSRVHNTGWQGVCIGLLPELASTRLVAAAHACGMATYWIASVSRWLPSGLVLSADNPEPLTKLARSQGLEIVVARPLGDCLASLEQVLQTEEPPGNYTLHAVWNWEGGYFQRFQEPSKELDIPGVYCYRRPSGDRRDYFLVRAENGQRLWSYSRVWSLMAGARFAGRETYVYSSEEGFYRRARGIYLPMVVGRLAFALTGIAPGPVEQANGDIDYRYPVYNIEIAEVIGVCLLGWLRRNQEKSHVPEWLRALALARSPNEPCLVLATESGKQPITIPTSLLPLYRQFIRVR